MGLHDLQILQDPLEGLDLSSSEEVLRANPQLQAAGIQLGVQFSRASVKMHAFKNLEGLVKLPLGQIEITKRLRGYFCSAHELILEDAAKGLHLVGLLLSVTHSKNFVQANCFLTLV